MSASVWKKVKLINKADVNRGGSPRPIEAYITENMDGINWIKIGDVEKGAKYIEKTKERIIPEGESHSRKVVKGDFLLSNSMSFGRPYILHVDGCIHDGWLAIQNYNESFNTEFLYYLLSSDDIQRQYKSLAAGSTVLNLNKDIVSDVKVTYPIDLEEQKHISDILSTCDTVIQNTQKTIEKYKAIKQGMMQDLFTRGLTKDGKLRPSYEEAPEHYKQSELGMIPKEWEVKTTNELAKRLWIGLVTTMTSHYVEKGVPLIRNSDISENKIDDVEIFLDYDFANLNASREVHKGDVVTVHTGEIGTSAVIDDKYDGAHGFATINTTVNKSIISEDYYCRYMNSNAFKRQAFRAITGDGRQNLNIYDFVNLLIPYPIDKDEQIAIAKRLSSIDSTIQKEEAILAKYKNIKTGLMARLLTPPEDAQIIDETEE